MARFEAQVWNQDVHVEGGEFDSLEQAIEWYRSNFDLSLDDLQLLVREGGEEILIAYGDTIAWWRGDLLEEVLDLAEKYDLGVGTEGDLRQALARAVEQGGFPKVTLAGRTFYQVGDWLVSPGGGMVFRRP